MQTSHRTTLMLRAKVVVVGDACVGKTAVVQMFKSGGHDYPKNYIMVREGRRGHFYGCMEAFLHAAVSYAHRYVICQSDGRRKSSPWKRSLKIWSRPD